MGYTKESAVEAAKADLAKRLGVGADDIETSVADDEFPDGSLGAAEAGEMSMEMITDGWKISLKAGGKSYEYRADKYQLRLVGYQGKNIKVG